MLQQIPTMKIQKSKPISAFGGMNFVLEHLENNKIGDLFNQQLPSLAQQSTYTWRDIIYSLLSIYLCGGDHIEDLHTHLKLHFHNNPFIKIPSPDTVLKRMSELTQENKKCRTKRGNIEHSYNANKVLEQLNVSLLHKLGVFDSKEVVLDYDNTIIFNEKSDSMMTYKRNPGYQPGVCTLNEEHVLYIENRNGNSDAKSFQTDTLERLFELLNRNKIRKADHFRADAASYQYDVVKLLDKEVKNFYIGCRNSYVEKYFSQVQKWHVMDDENQNSMEVGEISIIPFCKQSKDDGAEPKKFRLIVKRSLKDDCQLDLFTQDTYEYRAILTNNFILSPIEIARFYNHRGNMEKQFDILKNDFGWGAMPFSTLEKNTTFLYFTAICRNLYHKIINYFASKFKILKSNFRVKKFLFRFIILPSKWIYRSRQRQLRVYGKVNFST